MRRYVARHSRPSGPHSAGTVLLWVSLPGGQETWGLDGVRSLPQGAILRLVRRKDLSVPGFVFIGDGGYHR
jgi:hypothetical protein